MPTKCPPKPSGQAMCGRIRFPQGERPERPVHEALKVKMDHNKDYRILKMLRMWDEKRLKALSGSSPRENAHANRK